MARRATSPSNKQTKAQTGSSARISELAGAEVPRGGRKAKSTISEPTEPSLTDMFFPGGEEPMETGAEVGSGLPIKARRGRQPKAQPDEEASASMAADNGVQAESAPSELTPNSDGESLDVQIDAAPRLPRRRARPGAAAIHRAMGSRKQVMDTAAAPQPIQQAAARWDADTGTATFDWPSIERVAAADGPNRAMAKLLLAARAEGANSRWPF